MIVLEIPNTTAGEKTLFGLGEGAHKLGLSPIGAVASKAAFQQTCCCILNLKVFPESKLEKFHIEMKLLCSIKLTSSSYFPNFFQSTVTVLSTKDHVAEAG